MDIDRISGIGGTGQEQSPSWTREKMRRRKFAEDVAPEVESGDVPAESEDEDHDGELDVMA